MSLLRPGVIKQHNTTTPPLPYLVSRTSVVYSFLPYGVYYMHSTNVYVLSYYVD